MSIRLGGSGIKIFLFHYPLIRSTEKRSHIFEAPIVLRVRLRSFGRTGEPVLFPSEFRVCRQASQRSETLRVVSESFFSLSLERLRSAGETAIGADRHGYLCSTDPKSFASPRSTNGPGRAGRVWTGKWNLRWRSNGERATDRARIESAVDPLGSGADA